MEIELPRGKHAIIDESTDGVLNFPDA